MKQNEIVVGGTYETYVSGSRARVVVVSRVEIPVRCCDYGFSNNRRSFRFEVRLENETTSLLKHRSAAALHPV